MAIDLIYFISICLCFITALTLVFKVNTNKFFGSYLLAAYLTLNGVCNAFYLLIEYDFILYMPYLYKVPAPITFLIPPFAYLYVRATLYNESHFKIRDAIHLIPFVVFFINYIPLYTLPYDQKLDIVKLVVKDISYTYTHQDGFLPEWTNIVFRALQTVVYLFAQWKMIWSYFKETNLVNRRFVRMKRWIYLFVRMQTAYWVGLILIYFIFAVDLGSVSQIGSFISLSTTSLVSIVFLSISGYLLINPSLLIGINNSISPQELKSENIENAHSLFESIQSQIKQKNLFLNPKLSLGLLSTDLEISQKTITQTINQNGFVNFNDFINDFRIDYAVKKLRGEALEAFSVEAIALSSGFNSKVTFYRAFKKKNNCTPTEFLKS